MKVLQDNVFQPITLTIETEEELKIITAALNASHVALREQWENMGYKGKIDSDTVAFDMWNQLVRILKDNQ